MTPDRSVLDEAEIAIVGGGPAGAIAAFTLALHGHDVILIDKHSFPRDKACGDGLTSSAVAFLHQLELEQVLAGAQPIDAVRLFVDSREHENIAMHANQPFQACCIPRKKLDQALINVACEAGARLVRGLVTRPLYSDGRVVGVEVARGTERLAIRSRYLMAADGATSRLRRQLGGALPRARTHAYAVRQYAHSDRPLTPAFEIYAPLPDKVTNYGYGWVFPIDEKTANIGVGYLSAPGLPHPRSINELLRSFFIALQQHQDTRLGKLSPLGRAAGGPFGGDFTAEHCQLDGVIFVGDAAQVTDPITGEGIDQALRSAHAAALALDRSISRRAKRIDVGTAIARKNLRLGQNNLMIARLAHQMLKRHVSRTAESDSTDAFTRPGPLFSTAAAMLTANVAHPTLMATPAGDWASRIGYLDHLVALDNRLRDQICSDFVLASEILQREVCSGVGPLAGLAVLAGELSCGSAPDDRSLDAALCAELLCAFPTILSHTSVSTVPNVSTNNALAVIIGDYSLCRALTAYPDLGVDASESLGKAIEANSEGVALRAHDEAHTDLSIERYIDWARLTTGASLSLAATTGARLAGAAVATIDAFGQAGEELGVALQIAEDILALSRPDRVTGSQPWRVFMDGHYNVSAIIALEDQPQLQSALASAETPDEWRRIVGVVSSTKGLERARKLCQTHTDKAKAVILDAVGTGEPIEALCDVPLHCFASVTLACPAKHVITAVTLTASQVV